MSEKGLVARERAGECDHLASVRVIYQGPQFPAFNCCLPCLREKLPLAYADVAAWVGSHPSGLLEPSWSNGVEYR